MPESSDRVRNILIAGGGVAGWMAAAHIATGLRSLGVEDHNVVVVAPSSAAPLGVGEATVPSIRTTLAFLGIDERTFIERVGATLKYGIRFEGWRDGSTDDVYFHPFTTTGADGDPAEWLGAAPDRTVREWSRRALATRTAVAAEPAGGTESAANYAFHLDTARLGGLLCERALTLGARHVDDSVADVEVREGRIGEVITAEGRSFRAAPDPDPGAVDLFVDCTGFSRSLIGRLGARWQPATGALLCDRAVAGRRSHRGSATTRLYTTASAHSAGWMWEIDLAGDTSIGVVYSSAFMPDDEAEGLLRRRIGPDAATRRIPFRAGTVDRPWIGN